MFQSIPHSFLQAKIEELQQALFFSSGNSLLKIPVHIVNTLNADELGQIWFVVPHPQQAIQEFDKEFPAKLDFFKKGKSFYLKILGKAFIVTDPEELNTLYSIPEEIKQKTRSKEVVLLKVKIQYADYFETAVSNYSNSLAKIKDRLYKWFYYQQHGVHAAKGSRSISLHEMITLPNIYSN